MNKRQRKKLARIKNDWYTDKYKGNIIVQYVIGSFK